MTTASGPTTRDLWTRWGQNVRAEREQRGWTQVQLAKESGQSQATISAIERGVAGGSDVARYEIEKALGKPGLFGFDLPAEEAS